MTVTTGPDLMGELTALTARVEAATEGLSILGGRAPELRQVVTAVEERLAQRTWELALANAEAAARADHVLQLRTRLGDVEERLASFRTRLAQLPALIDEG
jgi:hypothetical protein